MKWLWGTGLLVFLLTLVAALVTHDRVMDGLAAMMIGSAVIWSAVYDGVPEQRTDGSALARQGGELLGEPSGSTASCSGWPWW